MRTNIIIKAAAGVGLLSAVGFGLFRWNYRMPLEEYTSLALYMGVLDDAICRKELEGVTEFPPKQETLHYKYHLFLELNRKKSRRQLQREIEEMEERLRSTEESDTEKTVSFCFE